MEQPTQEKRSYARVSSPGTLYYRLHGEGAGRSLQEADLVDYSIAGVRFFSSEELRKNVSVLIQLNLRNLGGDEREWRTLWEHQETDTLLLVAAVMWCQRSSEREGYYEVGTRFTGKA